MTDETIYNEDTLAEKIFILLAAAGDPKDGKRMVEHAYAMAGLFEAEWVRRHHARKRAMRS